MPVFGTYAAGGAMVLAHEIAQLDAGAELMIVKCGLYSAFENYFSGEPDQ
jgi:hypothetical protein